jgi:hypothetical protein
VSRHLVTLAVAGLACCAVMAIGAPRAVHAEVPEALGLVAEDQFTVAANSTFSLTVQLPVSFDVAALSDPASGAGITVTAYARAETRRAVIAATAGNPGAAGDSVDIDPSTITQPAPGQLTIPIQLETSTKLKAALRLAKPGVYPIGVDLTVGDVVVAHLLTFVNRDVAEGEQPAQALSVALAVGTDAPVVLDTNDHVVLDEGTIARLTTLADVLEASAIPATVHVAPRLLTALRDTDPDLASRLTTALSDAQVLSDPSLPIDPSAAAAAGQQQLYTQWLVDGEDQLAAGGLPGVALRTAHIVTGPLSEPGADLLRDLGTRLLLLTPAVYDSLDQSIGFIADTTQLVNIGLSANATLDAAIVDRRFGDMLATTAADPNLNAIYATAELLGTRQEISNRGEDPGRHSVLLGTGDLGLPVASTLGPFTALIAHTPGLAVEAVSQITGRTDTQLRDGQELEAFLPAGTGASVQGRIDLKNQLLAETVSTSSMLDASDPLIPQWNTQINSLPSSAVSDANAAALKASLEAQFAAIRGAIVPPSRFDFTLTGRSGTVRLKFGNTSDKTLHIKFRIGGSGKIDSPDQSLDLPPNETLEVGVSLRAKSNGRFPVFLDVLTPHGERLVPQPVRLTVTVTALSGLGNLATGAALLLLFTWWARHIRQSRRRRRSALALVRHPVSLAAAMAAESAALSPDAATSTLPPS